MRELVARTSNKPYIAMVEDFTTLANNNIKDDLEELRNLDREQSLNYRAKQVSMS
jgi:hypothetical protein